MKKNFTRITAGALALTMIATAASCTPSKNGGGESQTADKVMNNAYKAVELSSDLPCRYVDNIFALGDSGNVLISGSDEDGSALYITDYEFLTFNQVEMDLPEDEHIETSFNASVSYDGTIYALATVTDYGDIEMPDWDDENFDYDSYDWDAYYAAADASYYIYTITSDGEVATKNEIKGLDKYSAEENYFYLGDFFICGDELISVLSTESEQYVPIDVDGTVGDPLNLGDNNFFYTRGLDKDGNVYFSTYENDGFIIRRIDAETLSINNNNDIVLKEDCGISNVNSIVKGVNDYRLLISDSKSLYGIKDDNSSEEIINWVDSDLNGDTISSIIPLEDGDFIVYENDWNSDKNTIYRLTKRDVSELANTTVLNVAVEYASSELMDMVQDFNKTSDQYRIRLDDYNSYYEWDEDSETTTNTPAKQMMTDIAAGKTFDMIITSDGMELVSNLGKKGALADMYEFMGKNGTVSKDEITENVLKGCERDGKLVSLIPSYYVTTSLVKKKYFDGDSWTVDDMIEAYNKLPDGATPVQYAFSKKDVFSNLFTDGDYIDFENSTCDFNSPDFIKLLEFCNNDDFKEIAWDDTEETQKIFDDQSSACRNDKALIGSIGIYQIRDFNRQKISNFNEEVSLVGAPNKSGNRGSMRSNQNFCIMNSSAHKDVCWEFIAKFFTKEYQEGNYNYYLPARKDSFEKMLDEAMEDPYYLDENGKKITYEDTAWVGDEEIKIPNLTQEERDYLEEYILSSQMASFGYDNDALSIVNEEVEHFFEGERSAEETANIIQNRVSIFISEQS